MKARMKAIRGIFTAVFLFMLGANLWAATNPLPETPAEQPAKTESDVVYIIPIKGMIEPALLYVIRRGLSEAESAQARAIIFVMDTPGGTLDAASGIVRIIQHLTVPTYTLVEKDAYSAGAIIAMATDHIYMAPGSVIGDAMPIMMTPFGGPQEMPEDIKEKAVSGVAALIRSAAQSAGHDEQLAEKMVRRELEYKVDGKVISPAGQLLTLTNVEAEKPVGKLKKPLLSDGTVNSVDHLLETIKMKNAERRELTVTSLEKLARMIAAAAPLFLIAGLLGIYLEIKTPGFGLPGILGAISLAIFFWGHHIAGLAGMEDLLIFLIGVILVLVELLFLPGYGFIGLIGATLMIWGLLSAMVEKYPGGPLFPSWTDLQIPLGKLLISLLASAVGMAILAKFLPKTSIFNKLILDASASRSEGFTSAKNEKNMVGLRGKSLNALRPAGSALFGDRKIDVVSRGNFIEQGREIQIVEVHGMRIVVEEIPSDKTYKEINERRASDLYHPGDGGSPADRS